MRLLETSNVSLGRFDCGPADARWHVPNWIGARPHVVLPGTPVWISHSGTGEQVADRSRVLLYDADQEYRRRLLDPSGDHCLFLEIAPRFLEAVLGRGTAGFGRTSVPAPASARLAVQVLVSSGADAADPALVEEDVFLALTEILAPLRAPDPWPRRMPRAELVRSILALDLREPLRLTDVSAAVGLSPYHLVRWFKDATGTTPIAYRARLRVLAAIEAIGRNPDAPLADLASELGFASHSHLAASVRRETGLPPSALRRRAS